MSCYLTDYLITNPIHSSALLTAMKKIIYCVLLLLGPAGAFAQTKLEAKEILNRIGKGEAVAYQNAEIIGTLDFTALPNRQLSKASKSDWLGNQKNYVSTVQASVSFTNCTFRGDVLAYYSEEGENATYNANFEQDVRFERCTFERTSAFKYSEFGGAVSFQGSTFQEEALFKYSKFVSGPNFGKATFTDGANFKYVKFPKGVDFSQATFRDEASFKYAHFPSGANFTKATFRDLADFKYAHFSKPLQLTETAFEGSEDFKYAQVDGQKFSSYLLKSK